jgi:hypothetical protein
MYPIIERLASDTGITIDDANYIFTIISGDLVTKIPPLKQVIEDIFENAEPDQLKEHINKMIILLQRDGMEAYKTWSMPQAVRRIRQSGNNQIL